MRIIFSNDESISFDLIGPLADHIQGIYKHLQHVDIPYQYWDYPNQKTFKQKLSDSATKLGIDLDQNLLGTQSYYNYLHDIYVRNYDGYHAEAREFHELIHACENYKRSSLSIDYRILSDPLKKPFDTKWLEHSITRVPAGTVYVEWAELGKIPYVYWQNKEPNDTAHIRELAKPWLWLRGTFKISFYTFDKYDYSSKEPFEQWWKNYEQDWCQHYNLDHWGLEEQCCVIPIGNLSLEKLFQLKKILDQGNTPTRVLLN